MGCLLQCFSVYFVLSLTLYSLYSRSSPNLPNFLSLSSYKKSGVVGGDACISGTRIPVWDLVEYRRLGASDLKILEAYPQLTATNLYHAWVYADAFPDEMNAAIEANEAA